MPQDAPVGISTIIPVLFYNDAPAALDWLAQAFGFTKRMEVPGPDGSIIHAELSLGDGVIMLATARDTPGWKSPRDLPAVNQSLYLSVDDPDAHHRRAKAAGAEIVRELQDRDYGSREYSARDFEGHYWSFGTYRPGAYWTPDGQA